jgi:di/tricarboxylate transporter
VNRFPSDPRRLTALVAFLASAAGIVLQILGGWEYPAVPPGLVITLVAALSALVPLRWAPLVGVLAGAFIAVGFVLVGDLARLLGGQDALVTAGKWVQLVAVLVGTAAALAAVVRPRRLSRRGPGG